MSVSAESIIVDSTISASRPRPTPNRHVQGRGHFRTPQRSH